MDSFQEVPTGENAVQQQAQQENPPEEHQGPEQNVGQWERIAGGMIGGFLIARALKHPTLGSMILATLGGGLIYRGSTGYCPLYDKLKINRATG